MEFGEYLLVVESPSGALTSKWRRVPTVGVPSAGHKIVVDGERYEVVDVLWQDTEASCGDRQYSFPSVIVRPLAPPRIERTRPSVIADDRLVHPLALPTGPVGPDASSEILPAGLVAVLVWCGYRVQATYYKSRLRELDALMRGEQWFKHIFDHDRVLRLRKRSRSCLTQMAFLLVEMNGVPEAPIDDGATAPRRGPARPHCGAAASAPRSPGSPAPTRRALRLVRVEEAPEYRGVDAPPET
jgi:hypothetical protein